MISMSLSQIQECQIAYRCLVRRTAINMLEGKTAIEPAGSDAEQLEQRTLAQRYCLALDVNFKRKFSQDVDFEFSRLQHLTESINSTPTNDRFFAHIASVKRSSWLIGLSMWLPCLAVCAW